MSPVAFLAKSSRTSASRSLFLLLALTLGFAGAANANTVWLPGDVTTNGQGSWAASTLLGTDFLTVYALGRFSVGLPSPVFSMTFTGAAPVQAHLPPAAAPRPPHSTSISPPTRT